jgi:23S rRNA (guanosine2251-2'-O)-methyltransferase
MKKTSNKKAFLILHDIRSVHNVGSMFRTADAAGIKKIFLTGYTPTPVDRFGRPRKDLAKVALGAEQNISWEYEKNPITLIKKLKRENMHIVALEQSESSIDYKNLKLKKDFVLICGNEVGGVSKKILNECDSVVEIPMMGKKESLNVSVSLGISLFRLLDI